MKNFLLLSVCMYTLTMAFDTTCMLKNLMQPKSIRRFAFLQLRQRSFPNTGYPRAIPTKYYLLEQNRRLQAQVEDLTDRVKELEAVIAEDKNHPHNHNTEWYNTRYENRGHRDR